MVQPPEELWEEILLRLPPDDPSSLLRASLVCKQWRRLVSRRGFLRRLREIHRRRPILGFFSNDGDINCPYPGYMPTCSSFFTFLCPERLSMPNVLDCRHGRVLIVSVGAGWLAQDLLVWEPVTGYRRRVPLPVAAKLFTFTAAVVCAADGCDHWDCHGGPFRLVVVSSGGDPVGSVASSCEYSSETGAWGQPIPASLNSLVTMDGSILVGKSLYFLCRECEIWEYDLCGQGLAVIRPADAFDGRRIILMLAEDGGLGVAGIKGSLMYLWSQKRSGDDNSESDAGWILRRTILLSDAVLSMLIPPTVIGFAEEEDVVFVRANDGIFAIELKSGRARNIWGGDCTSTLFPFYSFYAPGQADH